MFCRAIVQVVRCVSVYGKVVVIVILLWSIVVRVIAGTTGETGTAQETPDKLSSEWWADYVTFEDEYKLEISGKLQLLAEVLKMSESIGDKV